MSTLREVVDGIAHERPLAIAVSGGVDSLTLMAFAHRRHPQRVRAFHAISPAVPHASTQRVQDLARAHGWDLTVIDAGETNDPAYLKNPVDRCFICKSHLYDAIAQATDAQIVSGTNANDMVDFRPGLDAARARGVRHPFVEAGVHKRGVRALAQQLGLGDIATLPAQPCLSSRVETGIAIDAAKLSMVNTVEDAVRTLLGPSTVVRCRVRKSGVVVEIDEQLLANTDERVYSSVLEVARRATGDMMVTCEPYRMGSAFLRVL